MARGIRQSDEEKLQSIDQELATMEDKKAKIQNSINELNNERKEILNSMRIKKLELISQVLEETGKTPDDILEMLKA
jgi:predicted nuclease with TOPRIM domain